MRRVQISERDDASARTTDSFAELFYTHFGGLIRLATLIGADDPEDVVQEAFARLHTRKHVLRDLDSTLPYLRATVVNLSRSRLRHLDVVRRHRDSIRHEPAPADAHAPEQAVVLREDQQEVLDALGTLPTRQREALVLRYWQELSVGDTAEVMGISPGAVKSHTARALAAMARVLEARS
jgi:RNA polymerase sigma-70 factor (sigma-E family)